MSYVKWVILSLLNGVGPVLQWMMQPWWGLCRRSLKLNYTVNSRKEGGIEESFAHDCFSLRRNTVVINHEHSFCIRVFCFLIYTSDHTEMSPWGVSHPLMFSLIVLSLQWMIHLWRICDCLLTTQVIHRIVYPSTRRYLFQKKNFGIYCLSNLHSSSSTRISTVSEDHLWWRWNWISRRANNQNVGQLSCKTFLSFHYFCASFVSVNRVTSWDSRTANSLE
jgi:hypothetical protein